MQTYTWLLAILVNLSIGASTLAQIKNPCLELERKAVDSLVEYTLRQKAKKSTIEASLKLIESAIECDSNQWSSRDNRIVILAVMGEYRMAISAVDDEFYRSGKDSSQLVLKAAYFEQLEMYDSADYLYKGLNRYFEGRLRKDPENESLIYHTVFTEFKTYGWRKAKASIDYYKLKYPKRTHLLKLLKSIHP
ncbi:MAG: hypothetical protein JNK10_10455 [Cyclobacteriaceae bacterium]|nr:hypothetical protein [Cyclobacteriaceae bacterium]